MARFKRAIALNSQIVLTAKAATRRVAEKKLIYDSSFPSPFSRSEKIILLFLRTVHARVLPRRKAMAECAAPEISLTERNSITGRSPFADREPALPYVSLSEITRPQTNACDALTTRFMRARIKRYRARTDAYERARIRVVRHLLVGNFPCLLSNDRSRSIIRLGVPSLLFTRFSRDALTRATLKENSSIT